MKILLIHGVFMRPFAMSSLAEKFRQCGHKVETFGYPLRPTEEEIGEKFVTAVNRFQPDTIVGHSLGGLVAMRALQHATVPVRKLVCLGSPINGSAIARKIAESRLSFVFSKAAQDLLTTGTRDADLGETSLGIVAGNSRIFGFNILFQVFSKGHQHDGTVAVHETKLRKTTDRIILPVGHTSMLFSDDVFEWLIEFIGYDTSES